MKRLVLCILIVFILSGCHSQKFTYGSSQIILEDDLNAVLELMMDKGNYNSNLKVPYNMSSLAIDYSNGFVVVEAVQFNVYRKYDGEEHHYDSTACFDVNGSLECKEQRGLITSEKIEEEILLTSSFDIFSTINVPDIVSELNNNYNISPTESTLIMAHLVLPSDITEDEEKYDNIAYFYDDSYHYSTSYEPQDMMLEIKVQFFGNGTGEVYVIYFEIE